MLWDAVFKHFFDNVHMARDTPFCGPIVAHLSGMAESCISWQLEIHDRHALIPKVRDMSQRWKAWREIRSIREIDFLYNYQLDSNSGSQIKGQEMADKYRDTWSIRQPPSEVTIFCHDINTYIPKSALKNSLTDSAKRKRQWEGKCLRLNFYRYFSLQYIFNYFRVLKCSNFYSN
jgi:hypothetical protein